MHPRGKTAYYSAAGAAVRCSWMRRSSRAEMADQPLHRPHRAVGQGADRVPLDLARHLFEHVDLGDRGVADDHALHDPPDPAAAFAAWRALAAALVLVELRQPRDRLDDVGRFVHHDQRRRAEAALLGDQRVEIHQHLVADRRRQARRRRAAGDHGQQIVPAAAHAAGMALDQLAHRDRHRLLDIARLVHMAGNAEDFRPGVARARPIDENHAAPRFRIAGEMAIVSTLLTVVGQP